MSKSEDQQPDATAEPKVTADPAPTTESARFDVHPSVVFQLGEHLISDVVQALVELVKNAYDADATYSKITVQTDDPPPSGSRYPNTSGYILVEDDGHGMNRQSIIDGWLVIANSAKRALKMAGGVTPGRKRTPLGDKGLGRLGVQRLGRNVEIATRYTPPDGQPGEEHHVAFAWDDFLGAKRLSEVPVLLERADVPTRDRGTRILVSDLREPDTWRGNLAIGLLRDGLSQLLSPYEKIAEFRVYASINGTRIDLAEIGDAVRRTAQVHYDLTFDGQKLTVAGRARLAFFRPPGGKKRIRFREAVESDQGARFRTYLQELTDGLDFNVRAANEAAWFVEFSQEHALADLDKIVFLQSGTVANPGPFRGEVDGFNLGAESASEALQLIKQMFGTEEADGASGGSGEEGSEPLHAIPVFSGPAEYNEYIKTMSGVRVYRDGFGIRVDRDWLRLASERTSGKSYYSLRPSNTLGYIALTARENAQLAEKTDREGFQVTPYFKNFDRLMEEFVDFSSGVQEFLRRAWVAFEKDTRPDAPSTTETASPAQIAARIQETLHAADSLRPPLERVSTELATDLRATRITLKEVRSAVKASRAGAHVRTAMEGLEESLSTLATRIDDAQEVLQEVGKYLATVAETNPLSAVLANEIVGLQDRLDEVYSMVGLGLTAEALSHELHHIADQLAARTQKAVEQVRKLQLPDAALTTYTEYVQSAVAALRKQLSHLAPSLKYVRERRDVLPMRGFIDSLAEFHHDRLESGHIRLEARGTPGQDFTVAMNRGKLTQVFDNLLLNSEYWLREEIRGGSLKEGTVTLEAVRPFVRVWDNGRGVAKTIEHRLFNPFVTAKKAGEGRGLGLFITRQLLESDGCAISVTPARNRRGNLYVFEIDFTGALHGAA